MYLDDNGCSSVIIIIAAAAQHNKHQQMAEGKANNNIIRVKADTQSPLFVYGAACVSVFV